MVARIQHNLRPARRIGVRCGRLMLITEVPAQHALPVAMRVVNPVGRARIWISEVRLDLSVSGIVATSCGLLKVEIFEVCSDRPRAAAKVAAVRSGLGLDRLAKVKARRDVSGSGRGCAACSIVRMAGCPVRPCWAGRATRTGGTQRRGPRRCRCG